MLATPRLGDLTRTHRSLWRGQDSFKSVEAFVALLRVAPSVDILKISCNVSSIDPVRVHFLGLSTSLELVVKVRGHWRNSRNSLLVEWTDSLLRKLGPQLRQLDVEEPGLEQLFDRLVDARCLETLHVKNWWMKEKGPDPRREDLCWPQAVVLPCLNSVSLAINKGDESFLPRGSCAFGSLLRAHSGQLRSLKLGRHPNELVDACPRDLHSLEVVMQLGMASKLQRITGLKELRIVQPNSISALYDEVENLFRTWPAILERLEIRYWRHETMQAVVAGRLSNLQHLVLKWYRDWKEWENPLSLSGVRQLNATLTGLPRLRSLVLFDNLSLEELRAISHDAIPTLELLVVVPFRRQHYVRDHRCGGLENADEVEGLLAVLQGLVRGGPSSRHGVLQLLSDCPGPESSRPAGGPRLLSRHPAREADYCKLCAEAADSLRPILASHYSTCTPTVPDWKYVQVL
ncbi:uncharacterized protein LOC113212211 [Frankliniella occidentalis]|uniref:Uncharacterized protein LOC113212211 n=1 Tax=Frankliniella occidentalis TaxID=133901 RepID=A0A6J1T079_FRAOC|nr:uncharacterized protein LOC113212211 [Frankliniella occidentalis]